MNQIRWVWSNMQSCKRSYIFALCSTVILQIMQLINPIITQKIVDDVVYELPNQTPDSMDALIQTLIWLVILMIAFTLARTLLRYISNVTYEKCGQKFLYDVKNDLYEKLQREDMKFYSENRTGDLMTRLTGDLEMGRHGISFVFRGFLECFFLFTATTVYMLTKDIWFTLALLLVTPFIFIATRLFSKRVGPLFGNLREKLSLLNSNAQENIAGNKVVRAFAREDFEIQKFEQKNMDYHDANLKTSLTWLKFFPIIEGLSQSMAVTTLLVGGLFLINGRITAGTFMAFNSLCWTLTMPMRMLGMLLNDLQRFFASIDKVIELSYSYPDIKNPKNPVKKEGKLQGAVSFQNVSVSMHGTPVLKNINLDIHPGETVAIMGSTGSGKTTLINCISRFLDVTQGKVLVDGIDVKQYDLNTLRKGIGLASQDVFLFSDTIDGNIAYGDLSLTEDEVHEFASLASADFVESTSDGFDTLIGERGTGLSGGQKQRIALARALAVRPSILILDDTTSAVDLETEKIIQHNLRNLDFPCTKIMVAQRISTTKGADKIVVMDKGEIIECGTHEELLKQKGYYYEVYALQNGISTEKEAG